MQLRPPARLLAAVGAVALATTLSSCGMDLATDRNYTPGAAVNDRDASVDVLGALVVSAQDGSGTFIASFSNNDEENTATVESIAGAGESSAIQVKGFKPVDLQPGTMVNLQDESPVHLEGDFGAGDFVTLEFGLSDDQSVQIDVPVYPPCNEFEGLDSSSSSSSLSSSSSTGSDPCAPEEAASSESSEGSAGSEG